jgi:primosomal protein N' (replication factor Y)
MQVLRTEKELTVTRISEILDQKTVLPLVKSLYEKGMIVLKEELAETYRIKTETFVTHAVELEDSSEREQIFKLLESAPKQSDVLLAYVTMMREAKPIMKRKLLKMASAPSSSLDALESKGILSTYEAEVDRVNEEAATSPHFTLNEDQEKAISEIKDAFQRQDVVLLHGVTGSGKTHVYMQMINETLAVGKQALYLVPEIALTAQLIGRLRTTYGEKIGIYHSKFSSDERMEIWNKVRNGTYQVVLGVRSALFMPFENLGLLVIDEEHEHTFKQFEPSPRYHARDAGIFLMSLMTGKTILGTATPSFDTYFNALRGKYGLVKMHRRWGDVMMPEMQIADLRDEYRKKSMKSHFSSLLYMHRYWNVLPADGCPCARTVI